MMHLAHHQYYHPYPALPPYQQPVQKPRSQPNLQKYVKNYMYQTTDVVGKGQFSTVFKGINTNSNETVAIKVIELASITDPVFLTLLNNEISVLKLFKPNPNLLRIHEVFNSVNNMYIVTELCDKNDLQQVIQKSGGLPEQEAISIFNQLLNGMQELRAQSIIHRDIKPANILIANGVPKFADFGFAISKQLPPQQQRDLEMYNVGTPLYMAPETLLENRYSPKTDIWSLGVVLYEMLYGIVPFYSNTEQELVQKLRQHAVTNQIYFPPNKNVSQAVKQLISGMLTFDHRNRFNLETILQNPTFSKPQFQKENLYGLPSSQQDLLRAPFQQNPFSQKINTQNYSSNQNQKYTSQPIESNRLTAPPVFRNQSGAPQQAFEYRSRSKSPRHVPSRSPQTEKLKANSSQSELISMNASNQITQRSPSKSNVPFYHSPYSSEISTQQTPVQPTSPKTDYKYLLDLVKFLQKIKQLLQNDPLMKGTYQDAGQQHVFTTYKLLFALSKLCASKYEQYFIKTGQHPADYHQVQKEFELCYFQILKDYQDVIDKDLRFLRIFNQTMIESEDFVDSIQSYLKMSMITLRSTLENALLRTQDYQKLQEPFRSSVILLDYFVTFYLLINLSKECGGDVKRFQQESKIDEIANIQTTNNVTKIHFTKVSQKIHQALLI